jgi:hypothetical protein
MITRILTVVASGLGFVPPGKDWIPRLQGLRGEFRRSASSTALLVLVSVMCFSAGTIIGITELGPYHGLRSRNPVLLAMALILLTLAAEFFVRRFGIKYVFEAGMLSCVSRAGAVRWAEDLRGIKSLTCTAYRGQRSMTILWSDHRRSIELYDSLWNALNMHDR